MFPKEFADINCINQKESSFFSLSALNQLTLSRHINNPIFVCVISYTETCEIPGITVAGANPDLLKYTSPADAEFLYYGHCKCINTVPVTPDGKPTPAIITRTALRLDNIPLLVVDAGAKIKPLIPYISFNLEPGKNIEFGKAIENIEEVKKAFEYGVVLGKELAKINDMVVIGESIPGGTTTALGVLTALGIDAKCKISSSMPENPHNLKSKVVSKGMENANISFGMLKNEPFQAIACLGDPMLASAAGIASGVINSGNNNSSVMLAGGTQMSAVIAILKALNNDNGYQQQQQPLFDNKGLLSIGTTVYLTRDQSSDLVGAHMESGMIETGMPNGSSSSSSSNSSSR